MNLTRLVQYFLHGYLSYKETVRILDEHGYTAQEILRIMRGARRSVELHKLELATR